MLYDDKKGQLVQVMRFTEKLPAGVHKINGIELIECEADSNIIVNFKNGTIEDVTMTEMRQYLFTDKNVTSINVAAGIVRIS